MSSDQSEWLQFITSGVGNTCMLAGVGGVCVIVEAMEASGCRQEITFYQLVWKAFNSFKKLLIKKKKLLTVTQCQRMLGTCCIWPLTRQQLTVPSSYSMIGAAKHNSQWL